jgi:light-regulated signal transduction histidine kinase (bacteriophytochrome)
LRKDGDEFPAEISLSPLKTVEGVLVISTIRDMSESKRVEQALGEKNLALAMANKELEAFSYSISHDLRAPLRHINGYVELLKLSIGPELAEKPGHYLTEIVRSADQMGRLVDDLLNFSRMSRAEMKQDKVDLNVLAQTALSHLESETKNRNIQWKWGVLPSLKADPALIIQAFINLLSNAIKYTRPRDPAEIEVGCLEGTGDEAVIFVRDNGVGFDMEYADKLFGVFQRLHLREEFEGSGIGLANVRRIISRHGGRTWAEGEVGNGATFYFSLPTGQLKGSAQEE